MIPQLTGKVFKLSAKAPEMWGNIYDLIEPQWEYSIVIQDRDKEFRYPETLIFSFPDSLVNLVRPTNSISFYIVDYESGGRNYNWYFTGRGTVHDPIEQYKQILFQGKGFVQEYIEEFADAYARRYVPEKVAKSIKAGIKLL